MATMADTADLLTGLATCYLTYHIDIEMDILTDKTAAYVNIDFLGLVSLLDATLDDIGTDGIALIVILVDVICQLIEGGADCLVA